MATLHRAGSRCAKGGQLGGKKYKTREEAPRDVFDCIAFFGTPTAQSRSERHVLSHRHRAAAETEVARALGN
jgi:hypothetical protein